MDGNAALQPALLNERQLRIDLAAAFRLAAKNDWTEAVANHFSVAVSADGGKFMMNRAWRHFSQIRASQLAVLDAGGAKVPEDIDTTAWMIHATMHARLPHARCILHLHPPTQPPGPAWLILPSNPLIKPPRGSSTVSQSIRASVAWRITRWKASGWPPHLAINQSS